MKNKKAEAFGEYKKINKSFVVIQRPTVMLPCFQEAMVICMCDHTRCFLNKLVFHLAIFIIQ
jgi:hypothetical protein